MLDLDLVNPLIDHFKGWPFLLLLPLVLYGAIYLGEWLYQHGWRVEGKAPRLEDRAIPRGEGLRTAPGRSRGDHRPIPSNRTAISRRLQVVQPTLKGPWE